MTTPEQPQRVQQIALGVVTVLALLFATWVLILILPSAIAIEPSEVPLLSWAGVVLMLTAAGGAALAGWIALRATSLEGGVGSFAVGLLGLSLAVSLMGLLDNSALPEYEWAILTGRNLALVVGMAGLYRFFALFPTAITKEALAQSKIMKGARWSVPLVQSSKFWPTVALIGGGLVAATLLVTLVALPEPAMEVVAEAGPGLFGATFGLLAMVWYAMIQVSFASGDADARRKLWWIRWGFYTSVMALVFSGAAWGLILVGMTSSWLVVIGFGGWLVPFPTFLVALGMAVLYEGAVDPRLAIGKTTVYGTLGVLFVILFSVVESIVSDLIEARLDLPGMVGSGASGAIVAAIILPLRGAVSRRVNRLLPFDG